MMWNSSGAGGETSFVNSKGGGAGGFSFFNVASGTTLDPSLPIVEITSVGKIKAGAVTYTNTTGTNGQVLTSNGAGETSWITISPTSSANATGFPTYVVGTSYPELGGTVIHLSPSGKHGIVVADQFQVNSNWYEEIIFLGTIFT